MAAEDYDEWADRGLAFRSEGKLEDALACYDRALDLNPCDTVTHTDYIRDEHAFAQLLRELTPFVLGAVFAGLNPERLRDPDYRRDLAARMRLEDAVPRAATARAVIKWALSQDDEILRALAGSAGSTLPAALVRRFLSDLKTALERPVR